MSIQMNIERQPVIQRGILLLIHSAVRFYWPERKLVCILKNSMSSAY